LRPSWARRQRQSAYQQAKSLRNKYFTYNSLFLKDLAESTAKSLIPKDRVEGVPHRVARVLKVLLTADS